MEVEISWLCKEISNSDSDIINGGGTNITLKWKYLFANGKNNSRAGK